MYDFGNGPVPAHQHPNGGGWVANTSRVDDSVYVGPNAQVYDHAEIFGHAKVYECELVCGDSF